MELNFASLSSGSSGNCYYLGNGVQGLLIDAGITATSIRNYLKNMEISINSIMGILVTHNHIDHIRGLEVLSRRNGIPVLTTQKIWQSILTPQMKISSDFIVEISLNKRFNLAGFDIEAFPVCHDAPETIGFHICSGDKKFTIVTDLGHICQNSAPYIKSANILVIESNYDEEMLLTGKYPQFLKARISSSHGHLGNQQASSFLAEIVSEKLKVICLAHLSQNNNTPELALNTLFKTFSDRGINLGDHTRISVLKRNGPSGIMRL